MGGLVIPKGGGTRFNEVMEIEGGVLGSTFIRPLQEWAS